MIVDHGWLALRWMEERDHRRVALLLAECFPGEGWTAADVAAYMDHGSRNNTAKVLTIEGSPHVLGLLFYTTTVAECRIRRIAVAPECRRNGYGRHMLKALAGRRSLMRHDHYTARVRVDDADAALFFRDALRVPPPPGVAWTPEVQGDVAHFSHARGDTFRYADGTQGVWFRLRKAARGTRRLAAV